uniref:Transposase IS116/IS110/IS902 family protein n=1 Tax=Candidatus Kentrum sp. LFY TaxID=2126342 RepID=A0A450V619_9GAMM|nr:MAG: Transposase IS116/IS110/IS902 family protein [Candidatus Kentron sp. LFY]
MRLISHQMQKLTSILSGEKNCAHKVLTDGGIRLAVVVSDIHGKSAREMIEGLSRGETPEQVLQYASGRLEATIDALLDVLAGESTDDHIFVLSEMLDHIEDLERRIAIFARQLLSRLDPYKAMLQALQTIPGIDKMGAAMLLVEIGDFASWSGVCPGNHECLFRRKWAVFTSQNDTGEFCILSQVILSRFLVYFSHRFPF